MNVQVPSPQTTLLILLGASSWPNSPEFQSSEAFANAARRLKAYCLNSRPFGLPPENLLDLFDSEKNADELDVVMSQFLEQRIAAMKIAGNTAKDILVYFIGHGGFVGRDADFYLAIRRTRMENPRASGLHVMALADMLTERARHLRRIIILDCCFAAAAFSAFQAGPAQVALEKTADAFEVRQKVVGFPTKGTTLLCSSSHKSPSLLLPDGSSTMFTKALLDVLVQGATSQREYLTLRDVKDAATDLLSEMRNAPKPVVLSPDQSEGDVADIPFFPNPWPEKQRLRSMEEERHHKVSAVSSEMTTLSGQKEGPVELSIKATSSSPFIKVPVTYESIRSTEERRTTRPNQRLQNSQATALPRMSFVDTNSELVRKTNRDTSQPIKRYIGYSVCIIITVVVFFISNALLGWTNPIPVILTMLTGFGSCFFYGVYID